MVLQTLKLPKVLSHIPSQGIMAETRQSVGCLKFPRLLTAFIGLIAGRISLSCLY